MSRVPFTTLSNWRSAPFNRWAFANVRELMPTAPIARDPQTASPLPSRPVSFDAFALKLPDGSTLDFEPMLRATATDALVVVHDGALVYEWYDGETTAQTPHLLMSATKSIVGLLAGVLVASGALTLERRVTDYVPQVALTAYRGATIRDLLDMRANIVLDAHAQAAYGGASGWNPPVPGGPPDLMSFLATLRAPLGTHGTPFGYISANTDLLGWAIERATGSTIAALLAELLWGPIGAENDASITLDAAGLARCTGGMSASARDLARVGRLVVDGGRLTGTEIVPEAWLEDIATNGDREAWKAGEFGKNFGPAAMSYRSGWYVVHDEPAMLFAMGIHGQNLFVDRANRLVIAKLSSQDEAIDVRAAFLTHRSVAEIRRCVLEGAR